MRDGRLETILWITAFCFISLTIIVTSVIASYQTTPPAGTCTCRCCTDTLEKGKP